MFLSKTVFYALVCFAVWFNTNGGSLIILQGRNDFAIFVITRELGILTWDEAFLSLRSTLLRDALRAKYCELIIGKSTICAAFQLGARYMHPCAFILLMAMHYRILYVREGLSDN